MKLLRYIIVLLLLGCSTPNIPTSGHWSKPPNRTVIADYKPGWFKVNNWTYRYMAADVEVARIYYLPWIPNRWNWVIWNPLEGRYLKEQACRGNAVSVEIAIREAEKRMYGRYWM